jgi:hypothetical protein
MRQKEKGKRLIIFKRFLFRCSANDGYSIVSPGVMTRGATGSAALIKRNVRL